VLSTPPAFILSQDQTLQFKSLKYNRVKKPDRRFDRVSLGHYLVFKDRTKKSSAAAKDLSVLQFLGGYVNRYFQKNEKNIRQKKQN
jgi:hypothetical protein